jgi:hypothetical protein
MDWATIKPALVSVFTELAFGGAGGPSAEWFDRPRSAISPAHRFALSLKITSVAGIGPDEERYTETTFEGHPVLEAEVCGHRRVILRVEAIGTENTDSDHALHVIEQVRGRLWRRRTLDTLVAVGIGLVSAGPALDTTYKDGGRMVTRATLDVTLLVAASDVDTIKTGVIEHVELTTQIKGQDGATLPSPPNVTDDTIPPL